MTGGHWGLRATFTVQHFSFSVSAILIFIVQAVVFFVIRSGLAWLISLFFFLLTIIKKYSQTFVYFCFHHFFNDFEKFHPFVTLPSVVALTSR